VVKGCHHLNNECPRPDSSYQTFASGTVPFRFEADRAPLNEFRSAPGPRLRNELDAYIVALAVRSSIIAMRCDREGASRVLRDGMSS
jgi:hypothetical protein